MNIKEALKDLVILAVDDDPAMRLLISTLLRSAGATVLTAADGAAGLAILARYHPDLILMDLDMPVLSGMQTARRARLQGFRGEIIAVSANAVEFGYLLEAGINGRIFKSVATERLVDEIAAWMSSAAGAHPQPPMKMAAGLQS